MADDPVSSHTNRADKDHMSRAAMTAWICAALAALGLLIAYFGTRMHPMERNAECQELVGMDDDCVYENARKRLGGDYRRSIDDAADQVGEAAVAGISELDDSAQGSSE